MTNLTGGEYYVNYTLGDDNYQQGPWSLTEAQEHRRDIASYAGITACYVTPNRDEKRKRTGTEDADEA